MPEPSRAVGQDVLYEAAEAVPHRGWNYLPPVPAFLPRKAADLATPAQPAVPVASPPPVASLLLASDGFNLPDDVGQEAADAYRTVAERWLNETEDWDEEVRLSSGHYYGRGRPSEPEIMQKLAAQINLSGTSDIVRSYHAIATADGLAAADDALRQWHLHKVTYEIATKREWSEVRERVGYPRP